MGHPEWIHRRAGLTKHSKLDMEMVHTRTGLYVAARKVVAYGKCYMIEHQPMLECGWKQTAAANNSGGRKNPCRYTEVSQMCRGSSMAARS